ncbi:hypothetical protein V5799_027217 [Amblyomma americanum]|uniref:Uncharacterized protein n=1 Tax=Amblyomma americanum TaxID=6943 RepID=A0AAQ4DGC6_AMBAM
MASADWIHLSTLQLFKMALSGADPWLTAHDALETKRREIMGLIMQRNQYGRQTAIYVQTTGKARQMFRQFMTDVSKLQGDLTNNSLLITSGEVERRQYMVNTLLNKGREMDALLANKAPVPGQAGRNGLQAALAQATRTALVNLMKPWKALR